MILLVITVSNVGKSSEKYILSWWVKTFRKQVMKAITQYFRSKYYGNKDNEHNRLYIPAV